ncbi:MAG: SAM-dependent methyltransferase, type 11, and glycosyltransferase, partial [Acidimicrobiia bacterium]|nr:SAM-dependent methyltransferase, type 11, and glycosyltransferase [Acidimicrobiia bacterium]
QVGGFDEAFGTGGFEDDDLCRRLVGDRWQLLMANRSFVHHHGHATFDGNGLDWQAIEAQNRAIFEAKHGSLVPAPAEVAGPSELNIPLDPGVALVVDHLDAEAVLGARGWTTMSRPRGCDLVTELDACDPRPSLVVVHGHDTMVDRLDVPVIVVGEPVTGGSADAYGDPTRPANEWLPGLLDTLRSTQTFGGLLLRCRLSLDADDLATAFEAVRVAEGMRPGTPQASNAMAVCAFSGGHYEEALALLNRAIEIDPSFGPAKDNLAALGI